MLGVRRGRDGVKGHAWVTVDGLPVVEPSVAEFAPIAIIGPAGVVEVVRGNREEDPLAAFGVHR